MPPVGAKVWYRCYGENACWQGDWEVVAVHAGDRTVDIHNEYDEVTATGVACDVVLTEAEGARLRKDVAARVAARRSLQTDDRAIDDIDL